jgi:hypothetical protein
MRDDKAIDDHDLDAGDFSSWVVGLQAALRGERASEVPCGGCTACCTSSQFVHIGPDETDTLAHIPEALLFPAPGLPRGHLVLGYDERGHCPMLIDYVCSIYEHRPRTCRTYDCRVIPAAGVEVDDDGKVAIARQARRWRFDYPSAADRAEHNAVGAAASFLGEHRRALPDGSVPNNATQLAVLAIEIHDSFLRHDDVSDEVTVVDADLALVRDELMRRRDAAR